MRKYNAGEIRYFAESASKDLQRMTITEESILWDAYKASYLYFCAWIREAQA